jgi:hypothetical protein
MDRDKPNGKSDKEHDIVDITNSDSDSDDVAIVFYNKNTNDEVTYVKSIKSPPFDQMPHQPKKAIRSPTNAIGKSLSGKQISWSQPIPNVVKSSSLPKQHQSHAVRKKSASRYGSIRSGANEPKPLGRTSNDTKKCNKMSATETMQNSVE